MGRAGYEVRKLLALVLILVNSLALACVSCSNLDNNNSNVAGTTFTTASVTPSANRVVLVSIFCALSSGNGCGAISSITGNSLTYANVSSQDYGPTEGSAEAGHMEVWRSMVSSPTTGALTITFGVSVTAAAWNVTQCSGVDITGTNGSGAIGNVVTHTSGSPASVTTTFNSTLNGTYGTIGVFGNTLVSANGSMTDFGFLWTPLYWAWVDGAFVFYDGYWGPHVGCYGGIVYGFGIVFPLARSLLHLPGVAQAAAGCVD